MNCSDFLTSRYDTMLLANASESGMRYQEKDGVLRCLDLDEDEPLPDALASSMVSYRDVKKSLQFK